VFSFAVKKAELSCTVIIAAMSEATTPDFMDDTTLVMPFFMTSTEIPEQTWMAFSCACAHSPSTVFNMGAPGIASYSQNRIVLLLPVADCSQ